MLVPDGYVIKATFIQRGNRRLVMESVGLLLSVFLFIAFTEMTEIIHSDFNLWQFIQKFDSPIMLPILGVGLIIFVYIHAFAHEKTHQLCYRIFGIEANLHLSLLSANVTLPVGDVCPRDQAIIVSLSPLFILEIIGIVAWSFITGGFLLLVILFLSANVGMATSDVAQSVWLRKYPKNVYFGFDGRHSVIWGPQDRDLASGS